LHQFNTASSLCKSYIMGFEFLIILDVHRLGTKK
jgi:hypothetical protein